MFNFYFMTSSRLNCIPRFLARGVISNGSRSKSSGSISGNENTMYHHDHDPTNSIDGNNNNINYDIYFK